jgi:shikimate kinase
VIWNNKLKELKVGLKFSREEGISFFGLDEVNTSITRGAKVITIKEGSAIMHKKEESDENVKLVFSGFSMIIVIEE